MKPIPYHQLFLLTMMILLSANHPTKARETIDVAHRVTGDTPTSRASVDISFPTTESNETPSSRDPAVDSGWEVEEASHTSAGRNQKAEEQESELSPPDGRSLNLEVGNPITNRCSDLDLSVFEKGRNCGSPLSSPCFDFGRCQPPPAGHGRRIYVYDHDCTLADSRDLPISEVLRDGHHIDSHWRKAALEAGLLAATYASACIFIHVNVGIREVPCASSAPLWNDGVNHVMVDLTDNTRDMRPDVADSFAMEAASNMHTCYYRSGFDMSVPLCPKKRFTELATIPARDRKYFLTMKGSVYLGGHGSEERMSLLPIRDEGNGVVVSMRCFEIHGEHLRPENVEFCKELRSRYDDHDYGNLLNTTFALVPAGRSPGTYRLGEVMSAGAIPVFVARDIIRPFQDSVDWQGFSFVFAPDQVGPEMLATLRAVPPEHVAHMQHKVLKAYWTIFGGMTQQMASSYDAIAARIVKELRDRIGHQR